MDRFARILTLSAALAATSLCSLAIAEEVTIVAPGRVADVADVRGTNLEQAQAVPKVGSTDVAPSQRSLRQHSTVCIGTGDFHLRATVVMDAMEGRGAGIVFDGGLIALDDPEWGAVLHGRLFGGGRFPFEVERPASVRPGAPVALEIERTDGQLVVRLNDFEMGRIGMKGFALGRIGFDLGGGALRLIDCALEGDHAIQPRPIALFTGADGDIDEYRDPAAASDGTRAIVMAVSVTTADDGSTSTALHARELRADGARGEPRRIELGELQPDLVALGFRAGDARPWKLLVQPLSAKRLVEELVAFDSADGIQFEQRARIDAKAAPLQLFPGAMRVAEGGALRAGATRVVAGAPRACVVGVATDGSWTVSDLSDAPGCEPVLLSDGAVLARLPKSGVREVIRGTIRTEAAGYEGAATAAASLDAGGANGATSMRVAQADPAFPYPLRELRSSDRGATWRPSATLWGSAAGHAIGVMVDGRPVVLFEGGDKARREHILALRLDLPTTDGATPVTSPTAPQP